MAYLWLFNPDNDVALASGKQYFTPPTAAAKLRRSGAALPIWLADPGDFVLASGINDAWLSTIEASFGPVAQPWNHSSGVLPRPWGWSMAVATDFARAGLEESLLPSREWLERFRRLSGRETAAEVHARLAGEVDFPLWPAAVKIVDAGAVAGLLADIPRCVIKTPWSSSGRGISFVDSGNSGSAVKNAAAAINRYGYVTVEPGADRICDFAMLFMAKNGKVDFQGLSWFETDSHGRYKSNFVGPQGDIKSRIQALYPIARLEQVARKLEEILTGLCAGFYDGPVGVDMLLARGGAEVILHPVVEINFRYTMGFLALMLEKRVAGSAEFYIELGDTSAACRPEVEGGKLTAGRLALTPPGGDFTFILEKAQ